MPNGIGSDFYNNINQLNLWKKQQSSILQKLSSGKRINSFADDPAGGVISEKLNSITKGIGQEISNFETKLSKLQTQEGGYSTITEGLQEIKTNIQRAQSDNLSEEDIQQLQNTVDNTISALNETVENTTWNDQQLISGDENLTDILKNGIDITSEDSLEKVDNTIDEVLSKRSSIGSDIQKASANIKNKMVSFENTLAAYSQVSDTDMAKSLSELVANQIKNTAGTDLLKQVWNINMQNISNIFGSNN